jgi:hypothetical protein
VVWFALCKYQVDCQFVSEEAVFYKFLAYMGLVPFFVITFAGLWALLCGLRLTWRRVEYMKEHALGNVGEVIAKFRRGFVITVIITLFLAHMPLTEEISKALTCDEYEDEPGVFYLHMHASPKILCYQYPHWRSVSYFFLCLYSIGIPLLGFFMLWLNRKDFDKPAFLATYGFLFKGFEQHVPHIYWEVTVVMGREVNTHTHTYNPPPLPHTH